MKLLGSSRIFASNYQLMITDSMSREITDEMNWDEDKTKSGFAGDQHTILVGTEADLNDHWVDLYKSDVGPNLDEYQRVFILYFSNETGKVLVSSVIVEKGDYTIYVAGKNLGVDQLSLGEETELTDDEYKERLDLERYSIFIVVGKPTVEGKVQDVS
jgi:hypothetical protein